MVLRLSFLKEMEEEARELASSSNSLINVFVINLVERLYLSSTGWEVVDEVVL